MRHKIVTRPVKTEHLSFDELYGEISHDWREKAERLQARRWHEIKNLERVHRDKRPQHFRLSHVR